MSPLRLRRRQQGRDKVQDPKKGKDIPSSPSPSPSSSPNKDAQQRAQPKSDGRRGRSRGFLDRLFHMRFPFKFRGLRIGPAGRGSSSPSFPFSSLSASVSSRRRDRGRGMKKRRDDSADWGIDEESARTDPFWSPLPSGVSGLNDVGPSIASVVVKNPDLPPVAATEPEPDTAMATGESGLAPEEVSHQLEGKGWSAKGVDDIQNEDEIDQRGKNGREKYVSLGRDIVVENAAATGQPDNGPPTQALGEQVDSGERLLGDEPEADMLDKEEMKIAQKHGINLLCLSEEHLQKLDDVVRFGNVSTPQQPMLIEQQRRPSWSASVDNKRLDSSSSRRDGDEDAVYSNENTSPAQSPGVLKVLNGNRFPWLVYQNYRPNFCEMYCKGIWPDPEEGQPRTAHRPKWVLKKASCDSKDSEMNNGSDEIWLKNSFASLDSEATTLTPEQEQVFFRKATVQLLGQDGKKINLDEKILRQLDKTFEHCQSPQAAEWRKMKLECKTHGAPGCKRWLPRFTSRRKSVAVVQIPMAKRVETRHRFKLD